MFSWIRDLWSAPAQEQVRVVEQREPSIEERLERILFHSRGVKNQNDAELAELIEDIDIILEILERAMTVLDNRALDERAKRLRTRLRSTRTRATNARAA